MRVHPCTLFVLLLGMSSAVAQPSGSRLRGESESGRTRKRLTEAQQKLIGGQLVADELQDILDQSGDDLVLVKENQYQPARRLVQQYLATLPDKQLETFRDRIEEPAKKLLELGKKKRDPQPLRELVERYFVSRSAEEGLLLLGELAFERGDFVAAGRYWRMLLPANDDGTLVYPKPKTDPVGVKAKLVLLRAMSGDREAAKAELERFVKEHPKASGPLGGVNGDYAETLAKLIAAPPALPVASAGWSSFAGGPSRDGRPDSPLPRYLAGERPRVAAIPRESRDKEQVPAILAAKRLAYFPIVFGGSAYIADAGRVVQFDLKTGLARVAFHAGADLDFDAADLAVPYQQEADYTLTAADGKLFARFGKTALPTGNETTRTPRNYIACLEPKPDAAKLPASEKTLSAKWSVTPPVGKEVSAAWEGAPVVADGRVYASFVRVESNRLTHAIACYPVTGGAPLWVADVFDTDPLSPGSPKHRHELLTLAGANVLYCSHTGVTVAVSAATGKPAWAFRNPPAERPPVNSFRDLCPAVYHDGRVFIAPADGDAVYALDADTGRRLWSTVTPIHVEQLLGVSQGRLIVTTHVARLDSRRVLSGGVRGFNVATGFDQPPHGWQNHEDSALNGLGRGVAGENLIFWPTPSGTKVLDAATGRVARPTNTKLPGNVAVAEGYIVVATATEVWWHQFDGDTMVIPPRENYPLVGVKDRPAFDPKATVKAVNTEFDPKTAPSLTSPAEERREAALPPFARPLLPVTPLRDAPLVLCDGRKLFAHDADSGKQLWQTPLGTSAVLNRVAFTTDDRLIALGDLTVVAADRTSGKVAWEFRVPDADPTPPLSAFTFVGNRLVARLGDRGLIALDLSSGKVAWAKNTADENAVYPFGIGSAPKFGPHIGTADDRVYVQLGDTCREIAADTGEWIHRLPGTVAEWTGPPVDYKGRAIVPADGGRVLPTLDTGVVLGSFGMLSESAPVWPRGLVLNRGGKVELLFDPGREASLSGVPPSVRVFGDDLLVVVPRNIGDELHRIPTARSPRPILLPSGVDLQAIAADDNRLYLPADGKVFAVSRETLKESWRSTLPDVPDGVRWKVLSGRTTLIVYPTEPLPGEVWDSERAVRSAAYHPTALRLIGTTTAWAESVTRSTFPVLILDNATGKIQQRLDVAVGGPAVAVIPRSDSVLVASTGRAVWLAKK